MLKTFIISLSIGQNTVFNIIHNFIGISMSESLGMFSNI